MMGYESKIFLQIIKIIIAIIITIKVKKDKRAKDSSHKIHLSS